MPLDRKESGIDTMPSPIVQKLAGRNPNAGARTEPELPKELKRARALGDLSENAEYTWRSSARISSARA